MLPEGGKEQGGGQREEGGKEQGGGKREEGGREEASSYLQLWVISENAVAFSI